MLKIRSIKGTHDLLPEDTERWRRVENTIHHLMEQYGYGEIRTPAFENTDLFIRGIGSESDIVTKEMYSWKDQGGDSLTLTPELTAPVVRAYLQHQLGNQQPLNRLYYIATLFRRERPQKGRQRQFHQYGIEAIGSPHPEQDAEVIALAYRIYVEFGIKEMTVKLNSIGSPEVRPRYLDSLRDSLKNVAEELCDTCRVRLNKNALRLFDCKSPTCQEILDKNAPVIFDSITKEDSEHFYTLTAILTDLGIPFEHDKKLVRGLDYYTRTTFEITSLALGAQDALCGGGRYDLLIEQIGGKPTPAIGFAAGIERLMLVMENQNKSTNPVHIYLVALGETAAGKGTKIAEEIRSGCGKSVQFETLRRSMKAQMREADRCNVKYTLILGDDEIKQGIIKVKDMETGKEVEVEISGICKYFNQ